MPVPTDFIIIFRKECKSFVGMSSFIDSPMGDLPVMGIEQLLIGLIFGIVMEVCIGGILVILTRHPDQRKKKAGVVPVMILFNNMCNIIYCGTSILIFFTERNCALSQMICNITSHLFFVSFDIFVSYCAYYVSDCDLRVMWMSSILIFHRMGWAVFDICFSGGEWDPVAQQCTYTQYPPSSYYIVGDIVSDSFATIVSIYVAVHRLIVISNTSRRLLERNVVRSFAVILVSVFFVWVQNTWQDQFWLDLSCGIQAWTYARAINYDLLFEEDLATRLRQRSAVQRLRQSVSGPSRSTGRASFSSVSQIRARSPIAAGRGSVSFK
ncbi:hypothetical protein BC830DRAFT_392852 [Chytriomyces sp. MP71]|nr:hypothetical protein BC830DRAFT_392852 [Chytriomyces sp. MP71]